MEYMHQGIKIEFFPLKAEFMATIGDEHKSFGSLTAAKKAIDDARLKSFTPFTAYQHYPLRHISSDTSAYTNVVTIKDRKVVKERGRYGSTKFYFIDGENQQYTLLLKNDPKVLDIVTRAGAINKAKYDAVLAVEKTQKEALNALHEELKPFMIDVSTYKPEAV